LRFKTQTYHTAKRKIYIYKDKVLKPFVLSLIFFLTMSFYYNQPLNDMYYTMYPQPPQDTATYYNYDMSLDQLPVFEYNNALQDDNFSIATASDLYPQLTSPSLLSVGDMNMQQMTPSSTPSPQLTTIYHHQRNTSFDSFFFAPMAPDSPPKRRVSSGSMTEKRHICPICNHR
jgi:hypothetical protein